MINWKNAAKIYRDAANMATEEFVRERQLRLEYQKVMQAAVMYREAVTKPKNPLVSLVSGSDVNVQTSLVFLLTTINNLEQFIQTYTQKSSTLTTPEKLDNNPPV